MRCLGGSYKQAPESLTLSTQEVFRALSQNAAFLAAILRGPPYWRRQEDGLFVLALRHSAVVGNRFYFDLKLTERGSYLRTDGNAAGIVGNPDDH